MQYDAGKLQTLARLLLALKKEGHRVLIFTQMTKMLDVLEQFLSLHGHVYLRLDGGTGVEKRQKLMDRFNNDEKIFCFILSTRSGGLGINLTGADTVSEGGREGGVFFLRLQRQYGIIHYHLFTH